jgi:hypothetical protein
LGEVREKAKEIRKEKQTGDALLKPSFPLIATKERVQDGVQAVRITWVGH